MSPTVGSTFTDRQDLVEFATTPTITNLSMPLANTEYSLALQTGTKILQFQLRGALAKVQFSFTVSETNTKFVTLPHGSMYETSGLNLTGKTLYVRSNKASQTLEVLEWG